MQLRVCDCGNAVKKSTKETLGQISKIFQQMDKEGTKFIKQYWTLGRYDFVAIVEGKDEKTFMKSILANGRHGFNGNPRCGA